MSSQPHSIPLFLAPIVIAPHQETKNLQNQETAENPIAPEQRRGGAREGVVLGGSINLDKSSKVAFADIFGMDKRGAELTDG